MGISALAENYRKRIETSVRFFKYMLMWTAENSPDDAGQLLEGGESLISCHFRAKFVGSSGGDHKGIR
jgi:hypothetical protein